MLKIMYQLHSRCLIKFFIRHRKAGVCRNPENHIDSTVRRVDKQTSARSSVPGTRQKNGIQDLSFFSMLSIAVVSQLCFCFEFVFTYVAFEFLPAKKVKFHNSGIVCLYKRLL